MCGRYSLTRLPNGLLKRFGIPLLAPFVSRFNIAPGQDAWVILIQHRPVLLRLRWGLVPSRAGDGSIGSRLFNAPAETLATKPAFRTSYALRRCLVLADGFYEWVRDGCARQPVRVVMADREPFVMARLWDRWDRAGDIQLRTFTIITTESNELLQPSGPLLATRSPTTTD